MSTTVSSSAAKQRAEELRTLSARLLPLPAVTAHDVKPLCEEAALAANNLEALADARDDFEKSILNIEGRPRI